MPSKPFDVVTPRTESVPANIIDVNSTKYDESTEYPIAEKQQNTEESETKQESKKYKIGPFEFLTEPKWQNVLGYAALHIGALYALFTFDFVKYKTLVFWGKLMITSWIFIIFVIQIFMTPSLLVRLFCIIYSQFLLQIILTFIFIFIFTTSYRVYSHISIFTRFLPTCSGYWILIVAYSPQ